MIDYLPTIEISLEEYHEMQHDSVLLDELDEGGFINWADYLESGND